MTLLILTIAIFAASYSAFKVADEIVEWRMAAQIDQLPRTDQRMTPADRAVSIADAYNQFFTTDDRVRHQIEEARNRKQDRHNPHKKMTADEQTLAAVTTGKETAHARRTRK